MRYLKSINENQDLYKKSFEDLKSLPYKDFVTKLTELSTSSKFKEMVSGLSIDKSLDQTYGEVKMKTLYADQLVPTQSQIGLKETLSWLTNVESINEIIVKNSASLFNNNRILVANNKWILDGHHRWSYVYALNPKAKIPCININLPGKTPVDILKDTQIAIATTYNDLYTRQTPIATNISQLPDKKVIETIVQLIPEDTMDVLRESYAATDFSKWILREFIIPESLYEQKTIKSDDFLVTPDAEIKDIDPDMDKLDKEDNDNPDKDNILNTAGDFVGILDPTGVVDVLNGISSIYQGEYFLGILRIISAIPYAGDLVAKPIIGIVKSSIVKKLLQKFGKYLKTFDARKAAELWLDLEKYSPKFKELLEWMVKNVQKITDFMGVLVRKVGDHWLKFKLFYNIFSGKISKFFNDIFNIKERLKQYLTTVPKSEVYGILSSNIDKIKRLIVDKGIDKMNINFAIGPHPTQTAIKAKTNPYEKDFKGAPIRFLNAIPSMMSKLSNIVDQKEEDDTEQKVGDFTQFKDKLPKPPVTEVPSTKVELPKETEDLKDKSPVMLVPKTKSMKPTKDVKKEKIKV